MARDTPRRSGGTSRRPSSTARSRACRSRSRTRAEQPRLRPRRRRRARPTLCAERGAPGDVYNLASGRETSIRRLAELVIELTGANLHSSFFRGANGTIEAAVRLHRRRLSGAGLPRARSRSKMGSRGLSTGCGRPAADRRVHRHATAQRLLPAYPIPSLTDRTEASPPRSPRRAAAQPALTGEGRQRMTLVVNGHLEMNGAFDPQEQLLSSVYPDTWADGVATSVEQVRGHGAPDDRACRVRARRILVGGCVRVETRSTV